MKKLSVIVPVYQVEQYLARCLDSILAQNISDMEILVIDDGSSDHSYAIMQQYAEAYPKQIRIFQKPNGGPSDTRNFGLAHAQGEYISFVDSDDFLEKGMYSAMLAKADEGGFDIVVCDLNYIFADGSIKPLSSHFYYDLHTQSEIKKSLVSFYPVVWNKLYHRHLFDEGLHFQTAVWFEDVEFLYRLFPRIHSIGVLRQPFYQYVQHEGTITSTFDHRVFDYLKIWTTILEDYKKNKIFKEYYLELQYSCTRYLYATFLKAAAQIKNHNIFWKAYRHAKKMVHENFSKPYQNPYFYKTGLKGFFLLTINHFTAWLLYLWFSRK